MRRLVLLLAVILTSCGVCRKAPVESAVDSVSVIIKESIIYKDSLIYVEVPQEQSNAVLPDTDTSRLETSLAKSEAWVSAGELHHTLAHKADTRIPKIISIPVYLKTEEVKSIERDVVIKEVEKDFNAWQSFRMSLGTIALILLLAWLSYRMWKIIS